MTDRDATAVSMTDNAGAAGAPALRKPWQTPTISQVRVDDYTQASVTPNDDFSPGFS